MPQQILIQNMAPASEDNTTQISKTTLAGGTISETTLAGGSITLGTIQDSTLDINNGSLLPQNFTSVGDGSNSILIKTEAHSQVSILCAY